MALTDIILRRNTEWSSIIRTNIVPETWIDNGRKGYRIGRKYPVGGLKLKKPVNNVGKLVPGNRNFYLYR